MPLSRTTVALLAAAALLAALLLVPSAQHAGQLDLPVIAAIDPSAATRIQLVRSGQTTVIERDGDRWFLRQPLQAAADTTSLRGLLRGFAKDLPMDLRIDEGSLEDYGLDDSNNVAVEIFTGGSEPAISMVLGADLPGGSTILRLPGSEAVYRARLGGRHRYDREATQWRNRQLFDIDPELVVGFSVDNPGAQLTFTRDVYPATEPEGEPTSGPWRLADNPMFVPDQATLDQLLGALARLRASELHAPDFGGDTWEVPAASAEVALSDGSMHRISMIVAPDGQDALARIEGKPDVYRIAGTWLQRLQWGLLEYRDKTIFSLQREQVDSIILEEAGHRVRIQQDLGSQLWRVVEPVVMDADMRKTIGSVKALSELRALRVSQGTEPGAVGLDEPRSRFIVELIDGSSVMLETGHGFQVERQGEILYAWANGRLPIYEISGETYTRMRQAFLKN